MVIHDNPPSSIFFSGMLGQFRFISCESVGGLVMALLTPLIFRLLTIPFPGINTLQTPTSKSGYLLLARRKQQDERFLSGLLHSLHTTRAHHFDRSHRRCDALPDNPDAYHVCGLTISRSSNPTFAPTNPCGSRDTRSSSAGASVTSPLSFPAWSCSPHDYQECPVSFLQHGPHFSRVWVCL